MVAVAVLPILPFSDTMEPAFPDGFEGKGAAGVYDGNEAADRRLGSDPMLLRRSVMRSDVRGEDADDIGPTDDGGLMTPVVERGADNELAKLVVDELGLE